jgi:hypothetical protein
LHYGKLPLLGIEVENTVDASLRIMVQWGVKSVNMIVSHRDDPDWQINSGCGPDAGGMTQGGRE